MMSPSAFLPRRNQCENDLNLTRCLHVRKELNQHFQNLKKPEARWKLIKDHAVRKQVRNSTSLT